MLPVKHKMIFFLKSNKILIFLVMPIALEQIFQILIYPQFIENNHMSAKVGLFTFPGKEAKSIWP